MADVEYRNRVDVKWHRDFKSTLLVSQVGGQGVAGGAILTLGVTEELTATCAVVADAQAGQLVTGIAEVLGSTAITASVAEADLTLGIVEPLSSSISIASVTSGFVTLGIAVDLSSTCQVQSVVDATITMGVVEILASSSSNASAVASLLTIGASELMTAPADVTTEVDGLLGIGIVEVLGSTSTNTSVLSAVLTLGITEVLTATSTINTDMTGELTLGVDVVLSATDNVVSTAVGLLALGIVEILASSSTNTAVVDASLDLGQDEPLSNSTLINSNVATATLDLGITEVLSSTCAVTSEVDALLLAGVTEILTATAAITSEADAELTIGEFAVLSSTINIESSISAFLILGITEVLSSTINIISTIPTATLIIGHTELLATTNVIQSSTSAELSFGQAEPIAHTLESGTGGLDSYTKLLLHANGDVGNTGHNLTQYGNPRHIDTEKVFGDSSMQLDGNADYWQAANHSDWNLSSSNFVLETRVNFISAGTGSDQQIIAKYDGSGNNRNFRWFWSNNNNVYFQWTPDGATSNSKTWSFTPTWGQWYHLAIVRTGSNLYLYIDGTRHGTTHTISGSIYNSNIPLNIGCRIDTGSAGQYLKAYIDETRISVGTDRGWNSSSFTLPTEQYTSDSYTKLLVHWDGDASEYDHNVRWVSGENMVMSANHGAGANFEGSYYFNGSSNHLPFTSSDDWNLSNSDFVVDFHIDFDTFSGSGQTFCGRYHNVGDQRGWACYYHSSSNILRFGWSTTGSDWSNVSWSWTPTPGQFYHVAFVRSGNTMYCYIDGVRQDAGQTFTGTVYNNSSEYMYVGALYYNSATSDHLKGYLDELRISVGTDRGWTGSTITVPTSPYDELTWNDFVVSSVSADLTIGHVELLATTTTVQSNVADATLELGEAADLSGTISFSSTTSSFMILGTTEVLSATVNITSEVDAELAAGLLESLSATINVVSNLTAAVLTIGIATPLSATCAVISNTFANLELGVDVPLSGTVGITSEVDAEIELGIVEILASTGPITSVVTDTDLTLGITEDLTSTPGITTEVDAFIDLGVSEQLSATTNAVVLTTASIALGVVEILASSATNTSVTVGSLQLGQGEDLAGPCNITTECDGLLSIGIAEILASTSIGTAVATANLGFGVTEPLEHTLFSDVITGGNDSYTKLLLHLDADRGNTGHAIYNNGNVVLDASTMKFGSGSYDFDGSSCIDVVDHADWDFASGNFVIDAWIKTASGSTRTIVGQNISGGADIWHWKLKSDNSLQFGIRVSSSWTFIFNPTGTTVPSDTWSHVAVVRSGNTWNMYIDGTRVGQTTYSGSVPNISGQPMRIGRVYGEPDFDGQMDEFRISKGTDRGWTGTSFTPATSEWSSDSYTKLLLHMNADDSGENHNVTLYGDTAPAPGNTKWNGAFYFDGTGDYMTVPDSDDWDLFGGDFVIDAQLNFDDYSSHRGIIGQYVDGNNQWGLYLQSTGVLVLYGINGSTKFHYEASFTTTGSYVHIAIVKSGSNCYMFANGSALSVTAYTAFSAMSNLATPLQIGRYRTSDYMKGHIDELRISKGTDRGWTSSFTAPPSPYDDSEEQQVSSWLVQSVVAGDITLGVIEVLTAECVCWTSISGSIALGVVEILASSSTTASVVDADLHLGEEVDVSGPCAVVSNVADTTLTLGTTELLASTAGYGNGAQAESTTAGLLSVGLVEILAATSVYTSIVQADLIIGIDEELTSTPLAQSSTSGVLTLGITEPLSATNGVVSVVNGDITLGADVVVSSSVLVQSVANAGLTLGVSESLSATDNVQSSLQATLVLGLTEVLTATTNIVSVTTSDLTLGIVSDLTVTCVVVSTTAADITLGITEVLSSTINCQTAVDGGPLLTGGAEELSCQAQVVSNITATLTLGISTVLSGSTSVASNVVSFINLGVSEPLTATSTLASSATGDVTLGVDVVFTGGANAVSSTAGDLFIGAFEIVTASSSTTSTVTGLLSLGIVEVLASTGPITSSVVADLTLGVTEPLSATTTSTSAVTGDLSLGAATELTSTCDVVSVTAGSIATGIVEVLGSTAITASVVDAELTLGITESLSHTAAGGLDEDTVLLLHMDDTGLTDSSQYSHTVTKNNQVDRSGAHSVFGGYSAIFDGTGDYLTVGDSDDWAYGTGEFVIDMRIRFTTVPSGGSWCNIVTQKESGGWTNYFQLYYGDSQKFGVDIYVGGTRHINLWTNFTPSADTWYHLALVRDGNDFRIYVDGTDRTRTDTGTYQWSGSIPNYNADLWIGSINGGSTANDFDGYIDELRISKGTDRGWTSNFTPPTQAYSAGYVISSVVTGELTLGIDVVLTGTSTIVSTASAGVLATGIVEVLGSSNTTVSVVSGELQTGTTEVLSSSISLISVVTDAALIIGVNELLASTAITTAATAGELTLGVGYYISGTAECVCSVDAVMFFGVTELLGSSIISVSYTVAELDTGLTELLASTVITASVVDAWLYRGSEEILAGSTVMTSIVTGVIEITALALTNAGGHGTVEHNVGRFSGGNISPAPEVE